MTTYRTISIDGLDIFYREAGSRDNSTELARDRTLAFLKQHLGSTVIQGVTS